MVEELKIFHSGNLIQFLPHLLSILCFLFKFYLFKPPFPMLFNLQRAVHLQTCHHPVVCVPGSHSPPGAPASPAPAAGRCRARGTFELAVLLPSAGGDFGGMRGKGDLNLQCS